MNNGCSAFRNQIPESLLGELEPAAQKTLEEHLAGCRPCAEERDLYAGTFGLLRAAGDMPAPRHFFVLPEERRMSPWKIFRQMPFAWQAVLGAAAMLLCCFSVLAAMRLQIRAEDRALTIGFGRLPAPAVAVTAPPQPVDTAALRTEIVRALEEKTRQENLEWVRTLRAEISRSNRTFTAQQRSVLETALAALESRVDNRLVTATQLLREGTDRSLTEVYRTVTLDRERDTATLNARINRVAVNSEVKSVQTDAVLETLLQVAELRTRQ